MGYAAELTTQDAEAAERIARLRNRHSGTAPMSNAGLTSILGSIGDHASQRRLYGYFDEEGELVSWMSVRYGAFLNEQTRVDEQWWLITGFFTSAFHNHFNFQRPETGLLLAHAFRQAEREQVYTYVYSVASRLQHVYERSWRRQTWIPMTGRYELTDLCTVPANTPAPREWMQRMMGGIKPDAIVFKKRVLRPEYRSI